MIAIGREGFGLGFRIRVRFCVRVRVCNRILN